MTTYKLYTGLLSSDGSKAYTNTYEPLLVWEGRLAEVFGGFTRYEAQGHWVDNGVPYVDDSLVYEILDFHGNHTAEQLNHWRHELRWILGQLSVLLTQDGQEVLP